MQRYEMRKSSGPVAKRGRAGEDASDLKGEMKLVAETVKELEAKLQSIEQALQSSLLGVPNLPDESVPTGADAEANVEVRRVGTPRAFDFTPQPH